MLALKLTIVLAKHAAIWSTLVFGAGVVVGLLLFNPGERA